MVFLQKNVYSFYIKTLILDFLNGFSMLLIFHTLSCPVSNPNMLLWSTGLFQFHYALYYASRIFKIFVSNQKVCILYFVQEYEYIIYYLTTVHINW